MCVTWSPISSMCPASISRGRPLALSAATELPWTSAVTSSANVFTSSRHTRAGPVSKPDGPGVSSSRLRKSNVGLVIAPCPWSRGGTRPRSGEDGVSRGELRAASTRDQPRQDFGRIHEARARTRGIRIPVHEFDAPAEQHPRVPVRDGGELLLGAGDVEAAQRDDHERSEEHTSELQSLRHLVCRLLLEKK